MKELEPKDPQYLKATVRGITIQSRTSPEGITWEQVYFNGDLGFLKPFPDKTGPIRFIKQLGHGGQGDIYLVKTVLSPSEIRKIPPLHREKFQGERPFVLKVSKPGTDLAVLEREIEVLFQADGQYLPRLIAYSVHNANPQGTEKQVFVLEEYLAAQELKKAIHEGLKKPLPFDLALKIIINTASALDYLINQKRLLKAYCDLDPTQIFFNRRGKVSFCDPAGSVRLVQIADKDKYGKIVYAAPELYDPKSKPNEQTDMFALGVILWEALTGIDPHDPVNQYPPDFFTGKNRAVALSVLKNQLLQRYGSSVPLELVEIVKKATEPDPTNRYSSLKEFRDALQQILREYQLKKIGPRIIAAGLVSLTAYYLAKQPIPEKTAGETPTVVKTVLIQPEKPETGTIYAEPAYGKSPTVSFRDLCFLLGLDVESRSLSLGLPEIVVKFPYDPKEIHSGFYSIEDLSDSTYYTHFTREKFEFYRLIVSRSVQNPEGMSYGFFIDNICLIFPNDGSSVIGPNPSQVKLPSSVEIPTCLYTNFPLIVTDSQRRSTIYSDIDFRWSSSPGPKLSETPREIPIRIDRWSIAPSERVFLTSGPEKFKEGRLTAIVLITSDGYPDLQKNIDSLPLSKRIEFELSGSKLNLFSRAWALVQVPKKQEGSSQTEESEFVFSPLRYTLFDLPPGPSMVNYCPLLVIKDRKVNSILQKLGYKLR